MTTQEFSNEFDILYNNIMSNAAPGLTEYEKSVFLTKAQSEIIKSYFNSKGNKFQEGFDDSEKRQYDFSNLIRTSTLFNINSVKERITDLEKLDRRSQVFIFPKDYFLSVNEILTDSSTSYAVIPLSHDEYQKLMLKPYAYPTKRGAWRLFTDKKNCNIIQEYIKKKEDEIEELTFCDYTLVSTWADQKRNLSLTIKSPGTWNPDDSSLVSGGSSYLRDSDPAVFVFPSNVLKRNTYGKIIATCSWNKSFPTTYKINLEVFHSNGAIDDEETFLLLQEGFSKLKEFYGGTFENDELSKAATHLDAMVQSSAPSKFEEFSSENGKTFISEVVSLPIAEIIGRFKGPINYQLRYVKRPKPIIVENLIGVSIDGIDTKSECELSSEIHPEILQRAVELAKAAYIGDLNSQIALGQTSETNMGIVAQSR